MEMRRDFGGYLRTFDDVKNEGRVNYFVLNFSFIKDFIWILFEVLLLN